MESRTLQLLEFPKALARVARFAVSESGEAACRALLPLSDPEAVRRVTEMTEQARIWAGETGFRLSPFPSLQGLFAYLDASKGGLDLDALFALKKTLEQAKAARAVIENAADASVLPLHGRERDEGRLSRWPLLAEWASAAVWPARVWSALSRCLDEDGQLKDESSPELLSARMEIRRIHRQCSKKVKEFIDGHNLSPFLQDDFITLSSDRYVLPLKANFKGRFPGIIHDYSQTGETCYFEPLFLVEQNNQLRELKQEEREAERAVLTFLTGLVREEDQEIRAAYAFVVELDTLLAKIAFAAAVRGRTLDIAPGAPLKLIGARHPLLELSGDAPVPLDLSLKQGQIGCIISGGNAGGKTVCLKTLGLTALMAMAGLPVPVEAGSSLPFWSDIFVFIGDEQSLEDHVSTFTAQITQLSRVFPRIGPGTLVILDEFGAGTDPSQGAALAQAVIDALVARKAHVAAATHFPALKAYALAKDEVRAASVLFDPKSKKPLYRLGFDQVGASQALDVAREHGLPEEVLRRAESYLLLDGSDAGAIMERLNALAATREKELDKLREAKDRLKDKRSRLEERYAKDKKALLDEVQSRSREIFKAWQAERLTHKQAMKELAKTREEARLQEVRTEPAADAPPYADLSKGTMVEYLPWKKKGRIEERDDKRSMVKLDVNGVGIWAAPADCRVVEDAASKPKDSYVAAQASRSLRLDLRGLRADVALAELESFLDRSLLGNFTEVEIIHGRGTGVLRKEVHRLLRESPAVKSFSLATEEHGGDGMTVVELK